MASRQPYCRSGNGSLFIHEDMTDISRAAIISAVYLPIRYNACSDARANFYKDKIVDASTFSIACSLIAIIFTSLSIATKAEKSSLQKVTDRIVLPIWHKRGSYQNCARKIHRAWYTNSYTQNMIGFTSLFYHHFKYDSVHRSKNTSGCLRTSASSTRR